MNALHLLWIIPVSCLLGIGISVMIIENHYSQEAQMQQHQIDLLSGYLDICFTELSDFRNTTKEDQYDQEEGMSAQLSII